MVIGVAAKRCPRCQETLLASSFSRNKAAHDGLHGYCKTCNAEYRRERYQPAEPVPIGPTKTCSKCDQEYERSFDNFSKHRGTRDGLDSWCRGCQRRDSRRWRKTLSWERRMIRQVQYRHEKRWPNDNFDLTEQMLSDLDDRQGGRCFWFNVPLSYGIRSGSAMVSVDRLDNAQGYTSGNIVLACDAANRGRKDRDPEAFELFVDLLRHSLQEKL